MACEHRRLKSVNCVIMCADCGAVMTAQYAAGGERPLSSAPSTEGEGLGTTKKRAARRKKEAEKT